MTVCGWVARRREHGEHLAFVDLRDHTGIIQCVIDHATDVRSEWVIAVTGTVRHRPEGTVNPAIGTGEVEIGDCTVEVLNEAEPPPFSVDDRDESDEPVRLKHRYVDLRRPRMQRNLRLRARVNAALRAAMDRQGFAEIETPLLWAPTPEGSREFSVPSRLHHGEFYALPQSPQLAKQLLMVGGFDRYFQIARCLRDEDLRADRQFEFMQLDMECSFASQDDVMAYVSEAVLDAAEAATGERPPPIERMTWAESRDRYGTDKPDLRFGLELIDLSETFADTEVKAFSSPTVKAIVVPDGATWPRKRLDEVTELAKKHGAAGLAWFRVVEAEGGTGSARTGRWPGICRSRRSQASCNRRRRHQATSSSASRTATRRPARCWVRCAWRSRAPPVGQGPHRYVWVVDFPMFDGTGADGNPQPAHHPFTMPYPEDLPLLATDPFAVRSQAYDLVLNGWELGSGSVRIHRRDIQEQVFAALGISAAEAEARFGFLLGAFRYGAPPHAGFAVGVDRLVAILAGEENIREVIAYPKTQSGADLLTGAPTALPPASLAELGIRVVVPPSPGATAERRTAALSLFADAADRRLQSQAPLAARLRPRTLDEVVGQEHLIGPGAPLRLLAESDRVGSSILWGPAGTGKTTLARLLADTTSKHLTTLSATAAGVKDVREALAEAQRRLGEQGQGTMLFIDEVHRFSKSQQDVLLPAVEDGLVVLIGATTENPFFEVESAPVEPGLTVAAAPLVAGQPAHADPARVGARGGRRRGRRHRCRRGGLRGRRPCRLDDGGDRGGAGPWRRGRGAGAADARVVLTMDDMARARDGRLFHQGADEHYDQISALIKSVRGSDPDAGLYWMARMIEAGEDPRFLARRMVILASEDIGLADPQAMLVAEAAARAVEYVGLPEAALNLAEAVIYLARAPKSNAVTVALGRAQADVRSSVTQEVPAHLRDAHYKGAATLGHGDGYVYPHDDPSGVVPQQYRPDALEGRVYYEPTPRDERGGQRQCRGNARTGRPIREPGAATGPPPRWPARARRQCWWWASLAPAAWSAGPGASGGVAGAACPGTCCCPRPRRTCRPAPPRWAPPRPARCSTSTWSSPGRTRPDWRRPSPPCRRRARPSTGTT